MAFRFPFVAWNSRNRFCDVEPAFGAELLAKNRGQLHTCLNVFSPLLENVAEKFSDVRKNIFQSDTVVLSNKEKEKDMMRESRQVVTRELRVRLTSDLEFLTSRKFSLKIIVKHAYFFLVDDGICNKCDKIIQKNFLELI